MQAEDENDVQAATQAKAEQVAEMAEFDEHFSSQSGSNKEVCKHSYIVDTVRTYHESFFAGKTGRI